MTQSFQHPGPSRRVFLGTTAAAVGVSLLPAAAAAPAKYTRYNVTSRNGQEMLGYYAKAIRAMMAEPVTSPFNYYRFAFIHAMDCPHGNWWFLPWHRGFTGYFEQICRKMSGYDRFTLPYWDWSATPRVPESMFGQFLTPTTPGFIAAYDTFYKTYADQIAAMYKGFTPEQNADLVIREIKTPEDLWKQIQGPPAGPMFYPIAKARGLTAAKPQLDEFTTLSSSRGQVITGLSPSDYITFGSYKADQHSTMAGFGPIEMFPHNKIHNCVGGIVYNIAGQRIADNGGFMQNNLSPVDPIFFLHHSNIDRLWDVWTRKQTAYSLPTTPVGADKDAWEKQGFRFFVDAEGRNLPHISGEYTTIGRFDYDYEPGTGEDVVPKAALVASARSAATSTTGRVVAGAVGAPAGASARFTLPAAALTGTSALFAKIELELGPGGTSDAFKVLLNAPANARNLGVGSPNFVELITFFGHHHPMGGTVTVVVPLAKASRALTLTAGKEQTLSVVTEAAGNLKATAGTTKLRSVSIVSQ